MSKRRGKQWKDSAMKVSPTPTSFQVLIVGLAKNIGVSNFRIKDLEAILKIAKHKPVINQIEFHPYLQQNKLRKYLAENDILLEAYAPLVPLTTKTNGPLTPVIERIAKKEGRTPAQVHRPCGQELTRRFC
jgi:diketogulonate reductase-like aldo/keto reductase